MLALNFGLVIERLSFFLNYDLLPPANEVWGKVIFLHQFVILFTGGVCVVAPGGMHGCSGGCMVARGVCVVALGGVHGCSQGGVHGCSRGACVVAPGGHAWFSLGGVRGFIQGGVRGFIQGGHAWFFQFFQIQ